MSKLLYIVATLCVIDVAHAVRLCKEGNIRAEGRFLFKCVDHAFGLMEKFHGCKSHDSNGADVILKVNEVGYEPFTDNRDMGIKYNCDQKWTSVGCFAKFRGDVVNLTLNEERIIKDPRSTRKMSLKCSHEAVGGKTKLTWLLH